jgi:serine/threonine protein kinase
MEQIGRYQIQRELGRGAMGVVFLAKDPAIGRPVVIKTIRLREVADPQERQRLRERLLQEARMAGALSHPHIVTVYDAGEQGDLTYIAMEYVNGPTLEQLLSRETALEPAEVLRILRETASALDYAHQKGIVHRDVKPANIMIHENGAVKITDFGIAKIQSSPLATQAGLVLGTPQLHVPGASPGPARRRALGSILAGGHRLRDAHR